MAHAKVLPPVACDVRDERINDAQGLVSDTRMEEEDEKGGVEPVGAKVNEECGAAFQLVQGRTRLVIHSKML